jgi:hypothetical protein
MARFRTSEARNSQFSNGSSFAWPERFQRTDVACAGRIAAAGLLFCLAVGCGPSNTAGMVTNKAALDLAPARVCVTSETAGAIAEIMTAASRKRLDGFGHPFKYESALDHITVTISNATLVSFDPQTKKATCKANIAYSFSQEMDALMKANGESTASDLDLGENQYSVQPAADETHLVYDFEGGDDYPGYAIQKLNELDSHGQLKQG